MMMQPHNRKRLSSVLLGGIEFDASEEYFKFRFQFFYIILIFSIASSTFFVTADNMGVNAIGAAHVLVLKIHLAAALICLVGLYNRKHLFYVFAWPYAVVCFIVFISAMLYVPQDEIRIIWFFINIPSFYLLLGRLAGILITIFSMGCVLVVNQYLAQPYSENAIATAMVGFIYISAFFYAYSSRSVSFYQRMLDYNEQLKYLAHHDPLTGVMNARAYYECCNKLIEIANREHTSFAVLFVDLDHFKKINDQHGHDAGDRVLKAVSACLKSQARNSDLIGRVGGEEFSIFLPNTELSGAHHVAEKLRTEIEILMPQIESGPIRTTASIGVAINRTQQITIASIQRQADQAMYHAKQQGRNRVSYIEEMDVNTQLV